jgi:hypothetical protein
MSDCEHVSTFQNSLLPAAIKRPNADSYQNPEAKSGNHPDGRLPKINTGQSAAEQTGSDKKAARYAI